MKYNWLAIFMCFVADLTAENNCIELEFSNIQALYSNISNPLVVNGVTDLSGYKVSNSGTPIKFEFTGKNELLATPQRPTNRRGCFVFIINPAGDTVLTKNIRVKRLPDPVAYFLSQKSGLISKAKFQSGKRLDCKFEAFDFSASAKINRMEITIFKSNGETISFVNNGSILNPEVLNTFSKVESHDKILFSAIKAKLSDQSSRILSAIVLTVK